jgi:acyl-coenzyme A synthetase/AMP-(fatty) acid ligase
VDAEAIRAHCEGKLAPYKIPKEVEFRPDLPKNAMGKTLKYLLK